MKAYTYENGYTYEAANEWGQTDLYVWKLHTYERWKIWKFTIQQKIEPKSKLNIVLDSKMKTETKEIKFLMNNSVLSGPINKIKSEHFLENKIEAI